MNKDRSSRYSKWSWLREKVATRDLGYCLVLTIPAIALLALVSANGRKTTRLGELEGRINSLDIELKSSKISTRDVENKLENLTKMIKNNTDEMGRINSLDLELKNSTNSNQDLRTRLEDLESTIKSNTNEVGKLKLEIDNNTKKVVDLSDVINKETTNKKTNPANDGIENDVGKGDGAKNVGSKKNGTSNAGDGKT